ncbi:MAG: hypothetical protein IKE15_04105 [Clostridia bacterium]|nr:hypothetical protein [Clostridia bacterium]
MERITPAAVAALKKEILSSLHCALPGTVESFDGESRTAVVRPAVKGMPPLRDVPVFMPWRFDVFPGDPCLVIFADCDTDAWLDTGEAAEPASGRTHSLSDAFAFVGFQTR